MQAPGSGDALAGLSPSEYARLSTLLDELLERTAPEREARLSELDRLEPAAARWLREVLAAKGSERLNSFLETSDILRREGPAWSATTLHWWAERSVPIGCCHF